MSAIKRPVLRYHGGKFLLAKWIISHFPDHSNYVEAFGGAGSVLLQKPRSKSEVYNDLWDCVVNVFRVLRDPEMASQLEKLLTLTPYSRTEFLETYAETRADDPVERARKTILRSFGGFGSAAVSSEYRTGFRANHRSNGANCAMDWMNFPRHIQSFVDRLSGVVIENRNYSEILKQQDSDNTLFYLDPPYVHETRSIDRKNGTYYFEMTDQDHTNMAKLAHEVKGMVIISGYDCPLYKSLFGDWTAVHKKTLADGARPRIETLWINAAARGKLGRKLFDDVDPDLSFGGPEY